MKKSKWSYITMDSKAINFRTNWCKNICEKGGWISFLPHLQQCSKTKEGFILK